MKKRVGQFFLPLILILSLSACNLQLVEGAESDGIILTMTANAQILEQAALAGQTEPPAQEQVVIVVTATGEGGAAVEQVIPAPLLPPAVGDVTVTVSVATNCRQGPGTAFKSIYGMPVGQVAKVVAKNSYSGYWIIEIPGQNGQTCWLWGQYATINGDTASLKDVVTPTSVATLTPTATKVGAATATASATPTATQSSSSGTGAVTGCMDPNGSNYDPKATISAPCTYAKPNAPTLGVSFVNCTSAGNGQMNYTVNLAWTDNSNNETGFNIYTNLSLSGTNANSTSYSFTETYLAGTVLNVSLTAYNSAGNSAPASTTFTCAAPTKPNAPTIQNATCTFTDMGNGDFFYDYQISWIDNSDNEDGFRVSGPDGETTYPANVTKHVDGFIGPPPPYVQKVTVYAYNSEGESAGSKKFTCP